MNAHADEPFTAGLKARLLRKSLFKENVKLINEPGVRQYYLKNGFTPIWYISDSLSQNALTLLERLRQARQDGLRPREYHISILNQLLSRAPQEIQERINIELLLTDSFMSYTDHLLHGRTRPAIADPEWHIKRPAGPPPEWPLDQLSGSKPVTEILDEAAPQEAAYYRLKTALKRYLEIRDSGGWSWPKEGRFLKFGDRGKNVQKLSKLLHLTGDLIEEPKIVSRGDEECVFDSLVGNGLRNFQLRHGLAPDGTMNAPTSKALGVSVNERIIQIELNMERWRWLSRKLNRPALIVNVPEFNLKVWDEKGSLLAMRVVVGQQLRRTPAFEGSIKTVVINPKWVVPDRIAVEDLLPAIKRDFLVLKRKKIRLYGWKNARLVELSPKAINWQNITPDTFDFQLVQDPGPENVQGRFKFVFPNLFGIYIHDTPAKTLFEQKARTFSSGCIRVENAEALAEYLLKNVEGKNWEQINKNLEKPIPLEISLTSNISVYLFYWTAWVDEDNLLQFRDDIYGRDTLLRSVLAY